MSGGFISRLFPTNKSKKIVAQVANQERPDDDTGGLTTALLRKGCVSSAEEVERNRGGLLEYKF